jgi:hypothetical protein
MGWADLVAGTRRAANQLLGGVPVTAGALSGMGILDMKSELTLEDSVISIEYALTVDTATFGALQYGDSVYIDSGWYRVRQEPIRIGDGSDCIVMLEKLADADIVLVGSSSAIFSLAAIAAGSVYVVGESTYALVITGSATGGEGPPVLGASSAVLAIGGTASGSVQAAGLSSIALQITGAAAGFASVVGASSSSLGITGSAAGVIGAVASGASSATLTIAGTSAGTVLVTGGSAQSLVLTGSATAAVRVTGSSNQSMVLSGTPAGTVQIAGASAQTLSITGTATGTAAAPGFDADALDWITRIETADGSALPAGARTAYNDFVVGLKTDGNWTPITAACMLRGARTVAGCLVPMKGTAPTAVDAAFVSGDYTRTTGLIGSTAAGSGSRKALDTNVNANTLSKSNFHIAVDTVSMVGGVNGAEIGAIDWVAFPVPGRLEIGYWSGGAVNEFGTGAITPSDSPYTIAGGSAQLGFKCVNRSVSTEATVRSGGTNYTDSRTATGSFMTGNLWVFARHNIPSPLGTYESTGARLGWYSIGTALTSLADLETRISDFTTAIGLVTY